MTLDFFVRLTLAAHKVAGILPKKESLGVQIQDSANKLLSALVLLAQENLVTLEQKRTIVPKAIRELGVLVAYLNYAKRTTGVSPQNFLVLEREYNKVGEFLRKLHEDMAQNNAESYAEPRRSESVRRPTSNILQNTSVSKENLSLRQTRILELMRNKPKVQVWELQKVLPEVTKRTLRRDLDDLLQRSLIIRQGEWNEVFYQMR